MNNIVLCGYMGCGKTTVGKALALKMNTVFIDMDEYIEAAAGMHIRSIFEKFGEEHFRKLETMAAEELSKKNGLIIATGGGAVLNHKNVGLLKSSGKIVLLDVPFTEIEKRLEGDRSRPLLLRPDRDQAMLQLYCARLPVYREVADLIIDAGDKSPDDVCSDILSAVS